MSATATKASSFLQTKLTSSYAARDAASLRVWFKNGRKLNLPNGGHDADVSPAPRYSSMEKSGLDMRPAIYLWRIWVVTRRNVNAAQSSAGQLAQGRADDSWRYRHMRPRDTAEEYQARRWCLRSVDVWLGADRSGLLGERRRRRRVSRDATGAGAGMAVGVVVRVRAIRQNDVSSVYARVSGSPLWPGVSNQLHDFAPLVRWIRVARLNAVPPSV
jgi:hypothetical protein